MGLLNITVSTSIAIIYNLFVHHMASIMFKDSSYEDKINNCCEMESNEGPRLAPIEWEMMDKNRFFTFSVVNSVALRTVLYPLTVIKTRLQVGS